jgi:hypothetical protein
MVFRISFAWGEFGKAQTVQPNVWFQEGLRQPQESVEGFCDRLHLEASLQFHAYVHASIMQESSAIPVTNCQHSRRLSLSL